jgi:3-hydroxyacyl-[acyl-carrier-protein] dehydratase
VALVGIDGARFRRPVRPGERVDVRIELERRRGKIWSFRARARVGGEVAAEADLLAAVKGIEK